MAASDLHIYQVFMIILLVVNRKQRKVNLERLRLKERRDNQHSRYRHLYQIRRSNGDVIARVRVFLFMFVLIVILTVYHFHIQSFCVPDHIDQSVMYFHYYISQYFVILQYMYIYLYTVDLCLIYIISIILYRLQ